MKVPIWKLKKSDLAWLQSHTCSHGHTYLAHYSCYLSEKPTGSPFSEKVGFLDIETTSLNASFGYVISYCIKELDGPIVEYCITPKQIRSYQFDKVLMERFVKDMAGFDRFVVHWGKDRRHDIPFLRTRALFWEIEFPEYMSHFVSDTWDIMKNKFKFHSNRLQAGCDFLGIPSKEHRLNPAIWQKAQAGDKGALDWILEHNREDVISTEALWKKIYKFQRQGRVSF